MVEIKIVSIGEISFKERIAFKQRVEQNKARKINDKQNNPAYFVNLYNQTGNIKFLNQANYLKIKNKKYLDPGKPSQMLEKDLPEIKDILNEEKEGEPSPIQKIMIEDIIRDNISNSDENNLLYNIHRDNPFDSDTYRDSLTKDTNIL